MKPTPAMQTDQQACFDERGFRIPCGGTGQDGDLRCGRPWPAPRFRPNAGLVRDLLTGLTWPRDAGRFEFPLTWHDAQRGIAAMNRDRALGHGDWRLPDRNALFGIVSHARINPALPAEHPFVNVFPGYYWTETTCARLPDQAWYVHLGGARVQKGMKQGAYMVWPVRGRNVPPEVPEGRRFRCTGKAVEDRWTGLAWLRDADAAGRPVSWTDALAGAETVNRTDPGDVRGWRLPNIRELAGLLSLTRHSPALAGGHPFENVRPGYWSATTSTYDPRYAWTAEFIDGAVGVGFKPLTEFHAWYVRGDAKKEDAPLC